MKTSITQLQSSVSNTQYHVPAVSQLYPRSSTLLNPTQFQSETVTQYPTQFQTNFGTVNPALYQPIFNTLNPTSQQKLNAPLYPLRRSQFQPIFGASNPLQFQPSFNTVQYPSLPARTQFQSSVIQSVVSPYYTTPSSISGQYIIIFTNTSYYNNVLDINWSSSSSDHQRQQTTLTQDNSQKHKVSIDSDVIMMS